MFFSSNVEFSGDLQISVNLIIRKSDGKILCAQGEQDFVNLLLSFLTFLLGGITRILGDNCSLGSINRLYKSIAELNEDKYFISKEAKSRLVDPSISPHLKLNKQILTVPESGVLDYYHYKDVNYSHFVQYFKVGEHVCSVKFTKMKLSYPPSPEGYVKGLAMYIVTDDLVISPLSPISALSYLNRFKTPPHTDLKEKVVTIGVKEVRKSYTS